MQFTETNMKMHLLSQTRGELSDIILPVIVISVIPSILFLTALYLIILLFITTRKKSIRVNLHACLYTKVLCIKDFNVIYSVMFHFCCKELGYVKISYKA